MKNDVRPYWEKAPNRIICREAKSLISSDPDLSPETVEKILVAQPVAGMRKFAFGRNEIGTVNLSLCISDNPKSCLGEIIARYAVVTGTPFSDVMVAVIEVLRRNGGWLTYFSMEGAVGVPAETRWRPGVVRPGGGKGLAQ